MIKFDKDGNITSEDVSTNEEGDKTIWLSNDIYRTVMGFEISKDCLKYITSGAGSIGWELYAKEYNDMGEPVKFLDAMDNPVKATYSKPDEHGNWTLVTLSPTTENSTFYELKLARTISYYDESADDPKTTDDEDKTPAITNNEAQQIIKGVLSREGTEHTDRSLFTPAYWELIERASWLPLYYTDPWYYSGEVCDGELGYIQESSSNTFEMVPVSESNMILKVKADCSPNDVYEVILNLEINLLKQNGKWLVDDVFVFDYDNTKKSMKEEAQTRITELDKQVTSGEWEAAFNSDREAGIIYGRRSYDELLNDLDAYKQKYLSER